MTIVAAPKKEAIGLRPDMQRFRSGVGTLHGNGAAAASYFPNNAVDLGAIAGSPFAQGGSIEAELVVKTNAPGSFHGGIILSG